MTDLETLNKRIQGIKSRWQLTTALIKRSIFTFTWNCSYISHFWSVQLLSMIWDGNWDANKIRYKNHNHIFLLVIFHEFRITYQRNHLHN